MDEEAMGGAAGHELWIRCKIRRARVCKATIYGVYRDKLMEMGFASPMLPFQVCHSWQTLGMKDIAR